MHFLWVQDVQALEFGKLDVNLSPFGSDCLARLLLDGFYVGAHNSLSSCLLLLLLSGLIFLNVVGLVSPW
mgnify:CR=1 FL=1